MQSFILKVNVYYSENVLSYFFFRIRPVEERTKKVTFVLFIFKSTNYVLKSIPIPSVYYTKK